MSYEDLATELAFLGMCFDFSTPFRTEDILHDYSDRGERDPIILKYIINWNEERLRQIFASDFSEKSLVKRESLLSRLQSDGDTSDMGAYGYGFGENQGVVDPHFCQCDIVGGRDYLNLEYCRKPLKGRYKALLPVSRFLKQEISLDMMLNTYEIVLRSARSEELEAYLRNDYAEEGLKMIGINKRGDY